MREKKDYVVEQIWTMFDQLFTAADIFNDPKKENVNAIFKNVERSTPCNKTTVSSTTAAHKILVITCFRIMYYTYARYDVHLIILMEMLRILQYFIYIYIL